MDLLENDEYLELRTNYSQEVLGRLALIENQILLLEKEIDPSKLKNIVRQLMAEFHSIKGNSAALRFEAVKIICHKVEDLVLSDENEALKNKVEILLNYVDSIKDYFTIYSLDKSIDDNVFVIKHKDIFENLSLIKAKKKESTERKLHLNVLVVGISSTIIKNIKKALPSVDFQISFANSSVNAIERIAKEKFDLVFSSYFVEPLNGLSLCMAIKNQWPKSDIKFVLMPSQEIEVKFKEQVSKLNPDAIFIKNADLYDNLSKFIKSIYFKNKVISKIICFDDEESIISLYQIAFEDLKQVQVRFITKELDFIKQIEEFRPDLVISDVHLPNINVTSILKKYLNSSDFIFITGDTESSMSKTLLKEGAVAIWDKAEIVSGLVAHLRLLEYEIN